LVFFLASAIRAAARIVAAAADTAAADGAVGRSVNSVVKRCNPKRISPLAGHASLLNQLLTSCDNLSTQSSTF
jgi:hypothetical protein